MPTYNKLFRDKIPAIIQSRGTEGRTRILDEQEYQTELKKKLGEELRDISKQVAIRMHWKN
jgi:predicted house-cleaning noncanonical NTP pyrophosphatase (MazG superfamily)